MAVVDSEIGESLKFVPSETVVIGRPVRAVDSLRVGETLISYYGAVLRDTIYIRELLAGNSIAQATLRDGLRFVEKLYRAQSLALTDGIGFEELLQFQRAVAVIEKLGLADAIIGAATYNLSLVQGIKLTVSLGQFFGIDVVDEIGLNAAEFARVLAFARVDEDLGVEATITPQLLLSVKLADGVGIEPEQLLNMLYNPTLLDGVEFEAGYLAPDGTFTTWAMNTRTGAVTEYADFTFNSFAALGNRYVGASSDGLYELLGDTDDGDDIIARIKGGFLQFGGTQLSRLKEAYIATTGAGQWVLKVRTKDGLSYNYRIAARDGRSSKFHMGKGQRSRYFAYELISDGSDFDLDTLEFVPIVVQRRV